MNEAGEMTARKGIFFRRGIRRKLWNNHGLSIAELMVTMLLLTLSSAGMAGGVLFAKEQYRASMVLSESKVLCSTLSDSIRDTLRNATKIQVDETGVLLQFQDKDWRGKDDSRIYIVPVGAEYGELWIGDGTDDSENSQSNNKRVVNSTAYSTYHLKARADITYDPSEELFHVTLTIHDEQKANHTVESRFDVFRLNPDS